MFHFLSIVTGVFCRTLLTTTCIAKTKGGGIIKTVRIKQSILSLLTKLINYGKSSNHKN